MLWLIAVIALIVVMLSETIHEGFYQPGIYMIPPFYGPRPTRPPRNSLDIRDYLDYGGGWGSWGGWSLNYWLPEARCYDYANSRCMNEPMRKREMCVSNMYQGCLEDSL